MDKSPREPSDYEILRAANIERNVAFLGSLGLESSVRSSKPQENRQPKKQKLTQESAPVRQSGRVPVQRQMFRSNEQPLALTDELVCSKCQIKFKNMDGRSAQELLEVHMRDSCANSDMSRTVAPNTKTEQAQKISRTNGTFRENKVLLQKSDMS